MNTEIYENYVIAALQQEIKKEQKLPRSITAKDLEGRCFRCGSTDHVATSLLRLTS